MELIKNILFIMEAVVLLYLGISGVYFLLFGLAARLYRERKTSFSQNSNQYNIAVLIPAYKEDSVILETTQSATQHKTKWSRYDVVVIADSLKSETIENLKEMGAKVIVVSFDKSTKAKSLNKALNELENTYSHAVVLDADNIMAPEFIDELVVRFNKGFKIVQGHRTAKNTNTHFAFLDGVSEEVNNAIFRKGHRVLGLSSAIIGSGFGCEYALFKKLMQQINAVGGFDKELELLLLKDKIKIAYAQHAKVYDEKIQKGDAFVNQRRRWLSAQFIYLRKNIFSAVYQLFVRGNADYFDKVAQFMLPPRIIALGLTSISFLFHLILFILWGSSMVKIMFFAWTIIFSVTFLSIAVSIPKEKYSFSMLKSALTLPKGFLLTIMALLKVRGANKKFIHTPHGINA